MVICFATAIKEKKTTTTTNKQKMLNISRFTFSFSFCVISDVILKVFKWSGLNTLMPHNTKLNASTYTLQQENNKAKQYLAFSFQEKLISTLFMYKNLHSHKPYCWPPKMLRAKDDGTAQGNDGAVWLVDVYPRPSHHPLRVAFSAISNKAYNRHR